MSDHTDQALCDALRDRIADLGDPGAVVRCPECRHPAKEPTT